MKKDVHTEHCYQGEYEDGCKYNDPDCTARPMTFNEKVMAVAKKYGWVHEPNTDRLTFSKDNIHIWQTKPDGWQVADLIDGEFKNHRPARNILAAMSNEAGTPYLDVHALLDEELGIGDYEYMGSDTIKGIQLVEDLIKDLRSKWLQNNLKDPAIACDVILEAIKGKYFEKMVRDACREYTEID